MSEAHGNIRALVVNGLAQMSVSQECRCLSEVESEVLVVGAPSVIANVFSFRRWWNFQEVIAAPEP